MTGESLPAARRLVDVPFQTHVDLLRSFLARREPIVERVQGLLNAQRKPVELLQDTALLARQFEDCVFAFADTAHGPGHFRYA